MILLIPDQFSKVSVLSLLLSIGNIHTRGYQIILFGKVRINVAFKWVLYRKQISQYHLLTPCHSLMSLDDLEDIDSVETNTTTTGDLITLNVIPGLPPKRLWNCIVLYSLWLS